MGLGSMSPETSNTLVHLQKGKSMVQELCIIFMKNGHMRGSSRKIKWKEKELLCGRMEQSLKDLSAKASAKKASYSLPVDKLWMLMMNDSRNFNV